MKTNLILFGIILNKTCITKIIELKSLDEIVSDQLKAGKEGDLPFLPQFGAITCCSKKKCCHKYKRKGKHCGGCPKK
ncbi:MAG: hypothetical protein R2728_15685 [Chitinophagales bacterium]